MKKICRDPALLARTETYRIWTRDRVRFADMDMFGHCNNKAFATFFEEGRVAFAAASGMSLDPGALGRAMIRNSISYRAEMHLGDEVRIGVALLEIGRGFITLGSAIFRGDTCTATEEAVLAFFDRDTKRMCAIPPDVRQQLEAFL